MSPAVHCSSPQESKIQCKQCHGTHDPQPAKRHNIAYDGHFLQHCSTNLTVKWCQCQISNPQLTNLNEKCYQQYHTEIWRWISMRHLIYTHASSTGINAVTACKGMDVRFWFSHLNSLQAHWEWRETALPFSSSALNSKPPRPVAESLYSLFLFWSILNYGE